MDNLATYIESLIFAARQPITHKELKYTLENSFNAKISIKEIDEAVAQVTAKFSDKAFAIEVVAISGGFQFLTKPAYHHVVGDYLKLITKKRLSRVALETLAIVAYKQPVTKSELEKIRGVNCDYAVQKLLDKELISITGRSDGPGRPLLYATSDKFMDYFGLKDLGDLPQLKDFQTSDNQIGEPAPVEVLPDATELVLEHPEGNGSMESE